MDGMDVTDGLARFLPEGRRAGAKPGVMPWRGGRQVAVQVAPIVTGDVFWPTL